MSDVVNWTRVGLLATSLFLAEVLVGFITGGPEALEVWIATSFVLSFCFSSLLFGFMAARQRRPYLHASLALLFYYLFSLALGSILPAWLVGTPTTLDSVGWFVLVLGLILGTTAGRFIGPRRNRAGA